MARGDVKTNAKDKTALPKPERKARGFMRAAELTPHALKSAGAKRGFAELRLVTEWRAVVGEALARICRPVKVSYSRSGPGLGATLVLTAEGARGPEIEMQKTTIIEKVNAFYGYRAVSRLSIDQSRSPMMARPVSRRIAGMAEPAAGWVVPAPKPVEGVADEGLALALARLGANVTAKARKAKNDLPDTSGPGTEYGSSK